MTTSRSIIFHLDEVFTVYQLNQNVNDSAQIWLEKLAELNSQGHTLNLTDRFESLWKHLDANRHFVQLEKIYFWLGARAGFTDTRVIFIWLKSWEMLENGKFFILKLTSKESNFIPDNPEKIRTLLKISEKNNSNDLLYSAEPRIGVK